MKSKSNGSSSRTRTADPQVIVVMLRQPRMHQSTEMRSDPFWEFGSFGLTGCHQRNLMHPKKAALLNGARLAFVQGGKKGSRLVYLTPPVKATALADRTEVTWTGGEMPFCYADAPVILDTDGFSHVPKLRAMVETCLRHSWMGKFASKFRTRREPLPEAVAHELINVYEEMRRSVLSPQVATTYEQALPVNPPCIDRSRRQTYSRLRRQALAITA
jgi:hypothetical protein